MKSDWLKELNELQEEEKQLALKSQDGLYFSWYDELIAQAQDVPHFLDRKDITPIIANAFSYDDTVRYHLLAYCIMPNHVHGLYLPLLQQSGNDFPSVHIIYSWKRFTANQINKVLDRKGSVWQQESYDHLVRDNDELLRIIEYIRQNPVKAGLVKTSDQWPGTWTKEDLVL